MNRLFILILQASFIQFLFLINSYPENPGFLTNSSFTKFDMASWVRDRISQEAVTDIDLLIKKDKIMLKNIDMPEVYYIAGTNFYGSGEKMLGLKAFQMGFSASNAGPFSYDCAYYAARIFYQNGDRDAALLYLNDVINGTKDKILASNAADLMRRARWEYISREDGLPDDSISGLDFNGTDLWVATWTGGVARYIKDRNVMLIYRAQKNGLISNFARDIKLWDGKVWIATTEGLCSFNPADGKWVRAAGPMGRLPVKKLEVSGGDLYAGTLGGGLYVDNIKKGKWEPYFTSTSNVTDLAMSGGTVYISALNDGLYSISGTVTNHIITNVSVMALYGTANFIWAGTYGQGLFRVRTTDGAIDKIYTTLDGLNSDYVEAIDGDSNSLIIGMLGGGAEFLNSTSGTWFSLSVADGLPSSDIVKIAIEGRKVWFGALSGGIGIYYIYDKEL